jgi:hypothetical protein
MVFFKDFGKTVTDLFKSDKYELDRTLEVKSKNSNSEWSTKSKISQNGALSSKLTYKQSDKSFGAVEVKVPTKGNVEIDYTTPKLVDGLKSNVILCQPKLDLKGKYTNGAVQSQVQATLLTDDPSVDTIYVDGSLNLDGFSVGASAKLKPQSDKMLNDYNVGVNYQQNKDTTISVTTSNECNKIATSFWNRYSPDAELAARYELDLDQPRVPQVEVGGRWKVDEKGTLQGFVRTGGQMMVLYKHKMSARMTASLGATLDTKSFSANSTKVHYKLNFEA